ncbi:MAG: ribosome maturation factor RimM [Halioglobus sp.]|nr:ribosome maturation factor RimM [Halioglobus sp.]
MAESGAGDTLVVGRITGCYGIRGWVRIHPYTESPEDFLALGGWQLKGRDGLWPLEFDDGRTHGKGLVAHIAGVDDRSRAESLSGLEVVVRRDALPPLEEGEYYWRDLQGLQVWCRDGPESVLLGTAERLIETGANDVVVVRACAGSVDDRERLIPYLPGQTVSDVDLEAGRIEVDWFLDEY